MLIDWVTVIFQIVNFLILLALLKWLLFDRIVRVIDERRARIEAEEQEAHRGRQEARQEARRHREKSEEIDRKRDELLAEARRDARQRREELREQAERDVAASRAEWERSFRRQREDFLADLRRQIGSRVCDVARKALADLADAELEGQVIAVFRRRLESVEDDQREEFRQALREGNGVVTVSTAWELSDSQRKELTKALKPITDGAEMSFECNKDLLCGLRVAAGGRAVEWSISAWLDELTEHVDESLRQRVEQEREAPGATQQGEGATEAGDSRAERAEPRDGARDPEQAPAETRQGRDAGSEGEGEEES